MRILKDTEHVNNSTVRQTINLIFSERELYNNGALIVKTINDHTKGIEKFSVDIFSTEFIITYLRPKTMEEISAYQQYKTKIKTLAKKEKIKHKNYIRKEAKKLGLLK